MCDQHLYGRTLGSVPRVSYVSVWTCSVVALLLSSGLSMEGLYCYMEAVNSRKLLPAGMVGGGRETQPPVP